MTLASVEKKFLTVMEAIGKDGLLALTEIERFLPGAAALATLIFPADAAAIAGVVSSTDLIEKAVAAIEQKFAGAGAPTGTGAQKLADVLNLVTPTVTQLLTQEGLHVDTAYMTNIVNAVVAILNVQLTMPATAA